MRATHNRDRISTLDMSAEQQPSEGLTVWQVLGSVIASFFGVQSSRNRKRDFTLGRAKDFIIVGFILTVVCCLTLFFVVSLVMRLRG